MRWHRMRCTTFILALFTAITVARAPALARSLGTPELQKDTENTILLHALVKKWAGWPKDCDKASVTNVVVMQEPTSRTSGWKERWSMLACGSNVDVDVSYTSSPDGGTLIRTNVATPAKTLGQGQDIVGLWVGTVIQDGVGEFEIWLTLTSQTSGVSQYPAHNCGGVLSGKMVRPSVYNFNEKIAWGGVDETENGCIDGEMELTVRDAELDLKFSAVHDGVQESAAGTLRRFVGKPPR